MTPLSNRPIVLTRRLFVVGYVLPMLLVAVGFTVGYVKIQEEIENNRAARDALCAQRDDLDVRIARTERVLRDVPSGPVFGIPRRLLIDSLGTSVQTRQNLRHLECKGDDQ